MNTRIELVYSNSSRYQEDTAEVIKNAHIVKVDKHFVVTCCTIVERSTELNTSSKSFVYTDYSSAVAFCDGYIKEGCEE